MRDFNHVKGLLGALDFHQIRLILHKKVSFLFEF
jgi:hypothetical protein